MGLLRILLLASVAVAIGRPAFGQSPDSQWNARLVGKPLYLRGFWLTDSLQFDGAGTLLNNARVGPVTLSGVDVSRATMKGDSLVIYGDRVALVAKEDATQGLERRVIQGGGKRKSHPSEELQITINPDAAGSFDRALATIFADGLSELSTSVPLYWKCYATSYFVPAVVQDDAEKEVTHCVTTAEAGAMIGIEPTYQGGGSVLPPRMTEKAELKYSYEGRLLRIQGTAVVHVRIGKDGVPVGIQVVRALGAGLDEQAMDAASHYRFSPATKEGVPVATNANIEIHFILTKP